MFEGIGKTSNNGPESPSAVDIHFRALAYSFRHQSESHLCLLLRYQLSVFRGSELRTIQRGIHSSPTIWVAMLQQTMQKLLVCNFVGVLSRGDFCGNFQILRGSNLKISRRRGDRPENFCPKIDFFVRIRIDSSVDKNSCYSGTDTIVVPPKFHH